MKNYIIYEDDLKRLIKNMMSSNMDYSSNFKRRVQLIDSQIDEIIEMAKKDMSDVEYEDEYDYKQELVDWIVHELQFRHGKTDDFWFDNEDEIEMYIKDNYEEKLS